ncbi:MAG: sulfotransferase [Aestuariibacter sp.]
MKNAQPLTVDEAIVQAKKAIRQRRFADAAAHYRSVLKLQPNNQLAKKGLRKLERTGKPLSDEPQSADIEKLVSQLNEGNFTTVINACKAQLKTLPRSALLKNVLGTALQLGGDTKAAIEVFDKLIAEKPKFAEAHLNRGIALRDAGRIKETLEAYKTAVRLNPRNAIGLYNLGNIYKDLGDFKRASESYKAAISLLPDFAQAHRSLAAISSYTPDDAHYLQMQKLWERSSGTARAELGFALAAIEDAFGHFDKCFAYLEDANKLKKAELKYDIAADRVLFAAIRQSSVEAITHIEPADVRPIFIVGMMRSGTSLIEQILASHKSVYGAGELESLNRLVLPTLHRQGDNLHFDSSVAQKLRDDYHDELHALGVAEPVITDKMPLNFRWLGFALAAFPEAKVVHVNREPEAVCWSIYKHFFSAEGNAYAYDLEDIGKYYNLYQELMNHWRKQFPEQILDVSYEKLTLNQETETKKLLSFCSLQWDPACLDFHNTKRAVATTSATQVRKAMYQGSSEAWRNYESYLDKLTSLLDCRKHP